MSVFIAIDGLDGSGKETQSRLLEQYLVSCGKKVRMLSFPTYDERGSVFVNMYLNGELGSSPEDTGAFAASSFFALDRYYSYRTDWQKDYNDDCYIIANRYTTANAVHQLSKLPKDQWDGFLTWLWDFEFTKLGLPSPDRVIYLEVPPETSIELIKRRSSSTGRKMDIHELDSKHLYHSYEAALYSCEKLGWTRITCCDSAGNLKTREEIFGEIKKALNI